MKQFVIFILVVSGLFAKAQVCFVSPVSYSITPGSDQTCVISGDVNTDGIQDMITASYYGGDLNVFLGIGNASFGTPINVIYGDYPHGVTGGDFNNDGELDLVTADYLSSRVSLLIGAGNGNFSNSSSFTLNGPPLSVITDDFNKDGNPDIAVIDGGVSILLGTGSGSFLAAMSYTTGVSWPKTITSGDFNGDGNSDIVTGNWSTKNLSVFKGNGNGTFNQAVNYSSGVGVSFGPIDICKGDFNGDNKLDIAVINDSISTNVWVLSGNGNCGFALPVSYPVGTNPVSIVSADFNGDSKIDLVTSNRTSSDVSILTGDGNGGFNPVINLPDTIYQMTVEDLNGDFRPDIGATANNYNVVFLLNCTPTPTCVASVQDSLFYISSQNWGISAQYSPQVTSATWYWGDGTSTTGLYPSHTYATSGWYNICVTAYTSCGDSVNKCRMDSIYRTGSSMVGVNVVSSVNEIFEVATKQKVQFAAHPNPFNDELTITYSNPFGNKLSYTITDVVGKTILATPLDSRSGDHQLEINTEELSEGIYFMSMSVDGKRVGTLKVCK